MEGSSLGVTPSRDLVKWQKWRMSDTSGEELLMIIDKQGKGPGEYHRISSISINENDNPVIGIYELK